MLRLWSIVNRAVDVATCTEHCTADLIASATITSSLQARSNAYGIAIELRRRCQSSGAAFAARHCRDRVGRMSASFNASCTIRRSSAISGVEPRRNLRRRDSNGAAVNPESRRPACHDMRRRTLQSHFSSEPSVVVLASQCRVVAIVVRSRTARRRRYLPTIVLDGRHDAIRRGTSTVCDAASTMPDR